MELSYICWLYVCMTIYFASIPILSVVTAIYITVYHLYINQWGIMIQISIEVASKLIRQYVSRSSNLAMWPCLPQPSHWPLPCQWSVAGRCETAVTIQLKRLGCPSRCHRIYGKPSQSLGQVMWLSWSLTSSSWHWCINDLCLTVWNPLVSWPSNGHGAENPFSDFTQFHQGIWRQLLHLIAAVSIITNAPWLQNADSKNIETAGEQKLVFS